MYLPNKQVRVNSYTSSGVLYELYSMRPVQDIMLSLF